MNTEAQHSPGPWFAKMSETWPHEHPENSRRALNVHGGDGQPGYAGNIITSIAPVPHVTHQDWANARLIAAAPELLEALEAVIAEADRDTDAFIVAKTVIARAKGETI